jgi:hypothetical protein
MAYIWGLSPAILNDCDDDESRNAVVVCDGGGAFSAKYPERTATRWKGLNNVAQSPNCLEKLDGEARAIDQSYQEPVFYRRFIRKSTPSRHCGGSQEDTFSKTPKDAKDCHLWH